MTNTGTPDLRAALALAEAALSDIGDADREPGDDLAWCEARAAKDLPTIRAALAAPAQAVLPNPYANMGSMEEAWRKGYEGGRAIAAPGSEYMRVFKAGEAARAAVQAVPAPGVPSDAQRAAVDHAHELLRRLGYRRDGDFFINVNRVGAEALHVSTIATIVHAAAIVAQPTAAAGVTAAPAQAGEYPELPEPPKWIERWHGSGGKDGYEGWSIVDANTRSLVAYLGREVDSDAVTAIVMAHNDLRASRGQAPAQPEVAIYGSPDKEKFLEWWRPYQLPDGWIARIELVAWHAWQASMAQAEPAGAEKNMLSNEDIDLMARAYLGDCGPQANRVYSFARAIESSRGQAPAGAAQAAPAVPAIGQTLSGEPTYREDFLQLAQKCGAVLTGKPDASEAITVVFSVEAWRAFDLATAQAAPVDANVDAAVQQDVERLDWLDRQIKGHAIFNGYQWQEAGYENDRGLVCAIQRGNKKASARAAIDAARAAQKGGQ